MEERIEINNAAQELLLEALKTVALPPQRAKIEFAYKGITTAGGVYEGLPSNAYYFSQCKQNSIIPIIVAFKYNHNEDIFNPSATELLLANTFNLKKDVMTTANQCITQGGKINMLRFDIGIPAEKGLKTLLEKEADKLFKQKYEISELNLVFSFSDDDDAISDTEMYSFGDTLDLRLGTRLEKKEITKLSKWFNKLKRKYDI